MGIFCRSGCFVCVRAQCSSSSFHEYHLQTIIILTIILFLIKNEKDIKLLKFLHNKRYYC